MSAWLQLLLLASLGSVAILWVIGSIIFLLQRPWRMFEREDRWIAWLLLVGWPLVAIAMCVELLAEYLEARRADGRR